MATEPVFNAKTALLSRLRMSETTDAETLTTIDQVISDIRVEFYRRLGTSRVNYIAGLSLVDNPSTDTELLRSRAAVTEVYWVMYKLVCILPVMYIETQYPIRNNFDDVPLVRDSDDISNFRKCLKESVEIGLGELEEPKNDNTGNFSSFSIGSSEPFSLNQNFIGRPCR